MVINGKLYAESPIYRGNARKTLFTRDGDGTQRLVSLAGEIAGTAQLLMDAFLGKSGNNLGLINKMWFRLYKSHLPPDLITSIKCNLREESYPRERFFDLRMGLRLDEDRWAAEANANYKMETLYRNSVFDIELNIRDSVLKKDNNESRLFYVLQEIKEGRFWFGAGKSKGLGRCRLEIDLPFSATETLEDINSNANHLTLSLMFKATNPVLVGWNWGKVSAEIPSFAAVDGRSLVDSMRNLTGPIRDRLGTILGGPILTPEDWKKKLASYLPRVIAVWLRERSMARTESWTIPSSALTKLTKGKFPLSPKVVERIKLMADQPYSSLEEAEKAINDALGKKANMTKRVLEILEHKSSPRQKFDDSAWLEIVNSLGLDPSLRDSIAAQIQNESGMLQILEPACKPILPGLFQQVDRQVRIIESDPWVDMELNIREDHIRIKTLLLKGKIDETQWNNPDQPPEGVSASSWREFLQAHKNVQFRHLLNSRNLQRSIVNDNNFIEFLEAYRDSVRQELSQSYNTDYRQGGPSNREISKKYGKPYDSMFMRMLSWAPSSQEQGTWEIYIPGSTIKGAFRKRASQILKTLWGENERTEKLLDRLFGAQNQKGLASFSDAYLKDPHDPNRSWCSMDGVRMDPKTGRPIEQAKADYLFAYGETLSFHLRIDMQDIGEEDMDAICLLNYLLRDFHNGDIPIGGEKTNGFGWVEANIKGLNWIASDPNGITKKLFGERELAKDGIWNRLDLENDDAAMIMAISRPLAQKGEKRGQVVPKADEDFISHRMFGGYCGMLSIEGKILTPISVQESGEPSFKAVLDDLPVNGWDFFSMSPPDNESRNVNRIYALPSKSIRGMIRHIYSIASDSREISQNISKLNPSDSLFGWVGSGPNQAIMGRLSFSFGTFQPTPEMAWFKVPYPYGNWQYINGQWRDGQDGPVPKLVIGDTWRLFPHAKLSPLVKRLDSFNPDTPQANYMRAILPGSTCRFTIRFWNLEKQELERLIWCIMLEPGLAHKMGKNRYLGFGSLKLDVLPESFIIDWSSRYSNEDEANWRLPLNTKEWINPGVIANYRELKRALNAELL